MWVWDMYGGGKLGYDRRSSKARRSVSLSVSAGVGRGETGRFLMCGCLGRRDGVSRVCGDALDAFEFPQVRNGASLVKLLLTGVWLDVGSVLVGTVVV